MYEMYHNSCIECDLYNLTSECSTINLHSLAHNDNEVPQMEIMLAESHRYQSPVSTHHIKPSSPYTLCQGLLYLCAYQRLNSENGIQKSMLSAEQLSLIHKKFGENGKTLSERKINNALLHKRNSWSLFPFAKMSTDPKKKKRRNMRFILVLP